MNDAITPLLQRLEDEIFFAVIDVVLDIDTELMVGSKMQVHIPLRRTTFIRYPILCPVADHDAIERYCKLRWRAGSFLKTHGFIDGLEYREEGEHHWDGVMEVGVPDRAQLGRFLTQLRLEEDRRNLVGKMEADIGSATARVLLLADSFHRVALRLRERRAGREPLTIRDEYDVQYLLGALLETQFDDIRPEEWMPSYAGRASRVDFLLKGEGVLVETKKTREGLTDGKLGDDLTIDIAHYKERPDCKALVCFVYDPDHRLTNPSGLENDLSKVTDGLEVRVFIRPKS